MDEAHAGPPDRADALPPSPPADPPAPTPADPIARLREAVAVLRSGNRPAAAALFSAVIADHPDNEVAWVGLAASSNTREAAAAALHRAEEINPQSPFVDQTVADMTKRWPGFADALAAARAGAAPPPDLLVTPPGAPPAAPETAPVAEAAPLTPVVAEAPAEAVPADEAAPPTLVLPAAPEEEAAPVLQPRRSAGRTLLRTGVGLLALGLLALIVGLLWNSSLFTPAPATPTAQVAQVGLTPTAPLPTAVAIVPTALPPTPVPPTAVPPTSSVPPTHTSATADMTAVAAATAAVTAAATPGATERQDALAAVRDGQYAVAIPTLEAATERNPADVEGLYYLGVAYLSAPDRPHGAEDAELTFRSLLARQAGWPPALDMLARSLIAQGRYGDAVPPAHEAAQIDPTRAEYYLTLGRAYEGGGDAADAAKAYAAAAALTATATPGTAPGGPDETPGATPPAESTPPNGATAGTTETAAPGGPQTGGVPLSPAPETPGAPSPTPTYEVPSK